MENKHNEIKKQSKTGEQTDLVTDLKGSTQEEIQELIKRNIFSAQNWLLRTTHYHLLDERFAKKLHFKMFGEVWQGAGQYRSHKTPQGVPPERIQEHMQTLLFQIKSWINKDTYSWPQILSLFHHYLIYIQPFANGNEDYAQFYAEYLAQAYRQKTIKKFAL